MISCLYFRCCIIENELWIKNGFWFIIIPTLKGLGLVMKRRSLYLSLSGRWRHMQQRRGLSDRNGEERWGRLEDIWPWRWDDVDGFKRKTFLHGPRSFFIHLPSFISTIADFWPFQRFINGSDSTLGHTENRLLLESYDQFLVLFMLTVLWIFVICIKFEPQDYFLFQLLFCFFVSIWVVQGFLVEKI